MRRQRINPPSKTLSSLTVARLERGLFVPLLLLLLLHHHHHPQFRPKEQYRREGEESGNLSAHGRKKEKEKERTFLSFWSQFLAESPRAKKAVGWGGGSGRDFPLGGEKEKERGGEGTLDSLTKIKLLLLLWCMTGPSSSSISKRRCSEILNNSHFLWEIDRETGRERERERETCAEDPTHTHTAKQRRRRRVMPKN